MPNSSITISYAVYAYVPSILLGGVTQTSAGPRLIIGQPLTSTVAFQESGNAPATPGPLMTQTPFSNATYSWVAPTGGNPFSNFQPTFAQASVSPLKLPTNSASNVLGCYFASPTGVNAAVTDACNCNVGGAAFTVTSQQFSIDAPSPVQIRDSIGKFQLCQGSVLYNTSSSPYTLPGSGWWTPNALWLYGASDAFGNIWGRYLDFAVGDPIGYDNGPGSVGYVQTVRRSAFNGGNLVSTKIGLDSDGGTSGTQWFYGSNWYKLTSPNAYTLQFTGSSPPGYYPTVPSDGSSIGEFMDMPGAMIPQSASPVEYTASFKTYILYLPPPVPPGPNESQAGSVFVPIWEADWLASGTVSYPTNTSPPLVWYFSDNGSGNAPGGPAYNDFPSWP
jgi:hypothetical protein